MSRSVSRNGLSTHWLIIRQHLASGIHPAGQCCEFKGRVLRNLAAFHSCVLSDPSPKSHSETFAKVRWVLFGPSRPELASVIFADQSWQRQISSGLCHFVQDCNYGAMCMKQRSGFGPSSSMSALTKCVPPEQPSISEQVQEEVCAPDTRSFTLKRRGGMFKENRTTSQRYWNAQPDTFKEEGVTHINLLQFSERKK